MSCVVSENVAFGIFFFWLSPGLDLFWRLGDLSVTSVTGGPITNDKRQTNHKKKEFCVCSVCGEWGEREK